jgi:uncharacterized protein involved in type VI secretion and phage assembly
MATISGVAIGIVSDVSDPSGRGRVQVRVPSVSDAPEAWAPTVKVAGSRTTSAFRKGDHMLVAFEHGDVRKPFVIGLLWSETEAPPTSGR